MLAGYTNSTFQTNPNCCWYSHRAWRQIVFPLTCHLICDAVPPPTCYVHCHAVYIAVWHMPLPHMLYTSPLPHMLCSLLYDTCPSPARYVHCCITHAPPPHIMYDAVCYLWHLDHLNMPLPPPHAITLLHDTCVMWHWAHLNTPYDTAVCHFQMSEWNL